MPAEAQQQTSFEEPPDFFEVGSEEAVLRAQVDKLREAIMLQPQDLEREARAPGGSIYGTSSNGARAAFARPANQSPIPRLFLVGGSTHPGGGVTGGPGRNATQVLMEDLGLDFEMVCR